MASPELPECPVCLQSYDGEFAIPRVLSCGHTACESCLKNLPQKYPLTIRCPACTQLVKYPSAQGPSSLPRNIDLLRLIPTTAGDGTTPQPRNHEKPNDESQSNPQVHQAEFLPRLWSDEFYSAWNNWVLPENDVLVEKKGTGDGFLKDDSTKVRLLKICGGLLDGDVSGSVFKLSYTLRVLNLLSSMKENKREELGLILKICSRHSRICKVYGLWGDMVVDGSLYLVFERLNGNLLEKLRDFEDGLSKDGLSDFAMMGMEICEAVIALHLKGLSLGCFSLTCFELDHFGHLGVALCENLVTGRMVRKDVLEVASSGRRIGDKEMGILVGKMLKRKVFVSPEVLLDIFKINGVEIECDNFDDSVGHRSDIWSLGCLLLTLLIGKQFTDKLVDFVESDASEGSKDNGSYSSCFHLGLMEKVRFFLAGKFGEELESLQQILCSCLNFDPQIRPPVIDLWKCIRKLIIKNQSGSMPTLDETIHENNGTNLVLGELCEVPRNALEAPKKDESQVPESSDERNPNQIKETKADKEFVDGLAKRNFKVKVMQGHLDCVTALSVGGGFLFSSSFDKSIHIWSLQDFSHVHTFKGHEHKVMAVIYVDEDEPLCVSGDSGGGIFLWSISIPLGQEPVKKWYEQKDWRYSGIHALTTARNGYLYSGSGDRSIKAWSLQDSTQFCTMDGHKSVVSALAACDGILYSGSWDGTIRLWSLSDHSLLTVLGEHMPRTVTSVLSLIAHQNILISSHENGCIKIWRNDVLMKSVQSHKGAIFAIGMEGKCLFTGGWDKNINVQEILEDEFRVDTRRIGSTPGSSVVTALLCWQGMLFVGHGDRTVKVYYYEK